MGCDYGVEDTMDGALLCTDRHILNTNEDVCFSNTGMLRSLA